jgi:hypothetical protein
MRRHRHRVQLREMFGEMVWRGTTAEATAATSEAATAETALTSEAAAMWISTSETVVVAAAETSARISSGITSTEAAAFVFFSVKFFF